MKQLPFYTTNAWRKKARPQALHDANYQCQRCGVSLIGMKQGAHVHHRKPYLTAPALATEPLNLIALCRSCHNAEHHKMKGNKVSSACDINGLPIDASHPWFKKH